MGRNQSWLGVLIAGAAIAACDAVDDEPVPQWTPWDQLDGMFEPEFEQVPVAMIAKPALRVVTYNVLRGTDITEDAAYFLNDPDLANADVIGLQEAERPLDGSLSDAGQLAAELHMGHVFVPTFVWEGKLHGIALLSRYPLVDVQLMRLLEPAELEKHDQAARAALRATIITSDGPFHIVNVHLDPPLNIPQRILQLRPAVLDAPSPVAIVGDFNTNDYVWAAESVPILPLDAVADTSQADALDGYMRELGFDTPTAELGSTWHGVVENQRLDSVFTRGLATGRGDVERELEASDHWPLWQDVRIRP